MGLYDDGERCCKHAERENRMHDFCDWMIPFLRCFSKVSNKQFRTEIMDGIPKTEDENDRRSTLDAASLEINLAETLFETQSKDHRDNNASLTKEVGDG